MNDIVRQKLDRIEALFPPERLNPCRRRLDQLWHGEMPDRYPFTYMPVTCDYYDAVDDPETRLHKMLDESILHGMFHDDWIPALFPGCRQSTIPNMLGAEEIVLGGDYTSSKIVRQVEDVERLQGPAIRPGSVARQWLDMQRYFLDETDGRIPIHVADMQGPLDASAQLWSYDGLITAAYTDPDAYQRMMALAMKAFVLFWEAQRDLLGDLFVPTHLWGWNWAPPDAGASLSFDALVMVSPGFYEQFARPWLVKIGEGFGGLAIHSCGDFSHMVRSVCETPTVRSINAAQMSVEMLLKAGLDSRILVTTMFDAEQAPSTFRLIREHNLRVDATISGVIPSPNPDDWDAAAWSSIQKKEDAILKAVAGNL
jgi:hypothetical protein